MKEMLPPQLSAIAKVSQYRGKFWCMPAGVVGNDPRQNGTTDLDQLRLT